jgi:hypothetical protein
LIVFDQDSFGKEIVRKTKYRLTKWSVICRPKDQGRLGVHDLEVKNRAPPGKWLARLITEDGVWQNKVCRLKGDITGDLETWGLALFGWPYGEKEILIPKWIFLYQGWFGDKVLGG